MKKNDFLILISLIVYVILFYQQLPGLNFLLFTILILVLLLSKDPLLFKNRTWMGAAVGSVFSAVAGFHLWKYA